MDKINPDQQPGLGTSAISGTLTLTKTGTTARTATFPDAAITVAGQNINNAFSAAQTINSNGTIGLDVSRAGTIGIRINSSTTLGPAQLIFSQNGSQRGAFEVASDETFQMVGSTTAGKQIRFLIGPAFNTRMTINGDDGMSTFLGAGVTVPNGTAAAPGIRTTTRPHGLYHYDNSAVGISADGVASIRIYKPLATSYGGLIFLENPADDQPGVICNTVATSFQILGGSGAAGINAGGQIRVYGNSHATKASYVELTRGTTVSAVFDGSGILTINNTTDATTTSDGSVRLSGGLSVAANKAIVAGGNIIMATATAAATVAGTVQRETNQDKHYTYANGIGGWLDKCIFSQYATVSQAGIVTDQSLASATARGTRTLPANFFKLGKVLRFRLCGRYTTDAAAGNGTIQIKLGSTVFRTTGSFALDNSATALPWEIEGEIVCQSTGATGTVEGVAVWKHMISGATSNYDAENLGGTAAVTIDTTASQAFDVIWTATDAGTTLTCSCFRLWEVC